MDDLAEDEGPLTVSELRGRLIEGVAEQAGEGAFAQAQALLDYVQVIMSPAQAQDLTVFRDQVVSRSIPFVQQSADLFEKHLRLMGVSHVLVNLLAPAVEMAEDEYITTRFEELAERLRCLERVEETNPSLDNRLTMIYQGLVELSSALGITTCDAMCFL